MKKLENNYLAVPAAFLSKESRQIFDPKCSDPDGGDGGQQAQKSKFLQYNKVWEPEQVGDYLGGSKIPSLLEFLENKMFRREAIGKTQVRNRGAGPRPLPHKTPKSLRQEERPERLERCKD